MVVRDAFPSCVCGEVLLPHIAFGDSLLSKAVEREILDVLDACQLLLCMGVSEVTEPVSRLIQTVLSGGGKVILLQPGFASLPDSPATFHLPFSPHRLLSGVIDILMPLPRGEEQVFRRSP